MGAARQIRLRNTWLDRVKESQREREKEGEHKNSQKVRSPKSKDRQTAALLLLPLLAFSSGFNGRCNNYLTDNFIPFNDVIKGIPSMNQLQCYKYTNTVKPELTTTYLRITTTILRSHFDQTTYEQRPPFNNGLNF